MQGLAVGHTPAQLLRRQFTNHHAQKGMGRTVAQRVIPQRLIEAEQAVVGVLLEQGQSLVLNTFQAASGIDGQTALVQDATQNALQIEPTAFGLLAHHVVGCADFAGHGGVGNNLQIDTLAQQGVHHTLVGALPGQRITGRGAGVKGVQFFLMLLRDDGLAFLQQQLARLAPHIHR